MGTRKKGYPEEVISWNREAWEKGKNAHADEIKAAHELHKAEHELDPKDVFIADTAIERARLIFAWDEKAARLDQRTEELAEKFSKFSKDELVDIAATLHAVSDLLATGLLIATENRASMLDRIAPALNHAQRRINDLTTLRELGPKAAGEKRSSKADDDYAIVKNAVEAAITKSPDRAGWTAKAMRKHLEDSKSFTSPYPSSATLLTAVQRAMRERKK